MEACEQDAVVTFTVELFVALRLNAAGINTFRALCEPIASNLPELSSDP